MYLPDAFFQQVLVNEFYGIIGGGILITFLLYTDIQSCSNIIILPLSDTYYLLGKQ